MPTTGLHHAALAGDFDGVVKALEKVVEDINDRSSLNPLVQQRRYVDTEDSHGETARDQAIIGLNRSNNVVSEAQAAMAEESGKRAAAADADGSEGDPSRWTESAIDFGYGKPKFTPDWTACAHIILLASHISVPEALRIVRWERGLGKRFYGTLADRERPAERWEGPYPVDNINPQGYTALHLAVLEEDPDIDRVFHVIQCGANLTTKDPRSRDARRIALAQRDAAAARAVAAEKQRAKEGGEEKTHP